MLLRDVWVIGGFESFSGVLSLVVDVGGVY